MESMSDTRKEKLSNAAKEGLIQNVDSDKVVQRLAECDFVSNCLLHGTAHPQTNGVAMAKGRVFSGPGTK